MPPPERMPSVAIYHPDAPGLFESFTDLSEVVRDRRVQSPKSKVQSPNSSDFSILNRPLVCC